MGLQFGIKEVLDLFIQDYASGEPVALIDYAEASENSVTGERIRLKGGHGNVDQLSFDHSKESTFVLTVPMVDLNLLALLAGEDLINDTTSEILKTEEVVVTDNAGTMEGTLSETPVDSANVKFYKKEGIRDFGEPITGATVTTTDVDFTGSTPSVSDGESVFAVYQFAAPAGAKEVKIKGNKFPKMVRMQGTGLARNQEDDKDYATHVKIYKAKPQLDMTFTMSGTEATNLEITFDLFAEKLPNGDYEYIDYVFETA